VGKYVRPNETIRNKERNGVRGVGKQKITEAGGVSLIIPVAGRKPTGKKT
jgi:hypothetical protein